MIKIKINNKTIEVPKGLTILQAAQSAGIHIPAMCFSNGLDHFTSCMVCLVKDTKNGKLTPSCSLKVEEGMEIITNDDEIFDARKTAIDLLLSEHVGDCEAPCTIACNAHMNIPKMNRLLAKGDFNSALEVVRHDIVLPSTLGRICPAPCEGACKRKPIDEAVSICLLKQFAGDMGRTELPEIKPSINKKVAIIGAGPAGLSAAYYLQLNGVHCTIIDKNEKPGGNLQYAIPDNQLPKSVLQNEINTIAQTGVQFQLQTEIAVEKFKKLLAEYHAVVIATGDISDNVKSWGLELNSNQLAVDKKTYKTNHEKVFAIGNVLKSGKFAIRSLAHGKEAATSVLQFLKNKELTGVNQRFNSRIGRLVQGEFAEYLKEADPTTGNALKRKKDITRQEIMAEAARCMHCDCHKPDNCKLRDYADAYQANPRRFKAGERHLVQKSMQQDGLIFEPGKCIKCGICVRLSEKHQDELGLTFIDRGFNIRIGAPMNKNFEKAVTKIAQLIAEACPTGALVKR